MPNRLDSDSQKEAYCLQDIYDAGIDSVGAGGLAGAVDAPSRRTFCWARLSIKLHESLAALANTKAMMVTIPDR